VHAMPSVFSFHVCLYALLLLVAVDGAECSDGDAACLDDASLLQLKASGGFGPWPSPPPGTEPVCVPDKASASGRDATRRRAGPKNEMQILQAVVTKLVTCTYCITKDEIWYDNVSVVDDEITIEENGGFPESSIGCLLGCKKKVNGSKITLHADRKKSSNTSRCFGTDTDLTCSAFCDCQMLGLDQGNLTYKPKELNFAIKAEMQLIPSKEVITEEEDKELTGKTVVCEDLRFGQGSVGGRNNWWMGCSGGSPYAFTLPFPDNKDPMGLGKTLQCPCSEANTTRKVWVGFCNLNDNPGYDTKRSQFAVCKASYSPSPPPKKCAR